MSWRRGRSAALRQLAKTILDILLRPVTVGGYNRVLVIQAWEGSAKMWWRRWVPVLVLVVGSGVLPVADGVVAPVALAQEGDDRGPETPSHPPRGESSGEPSADPARATRPDTDALLEAVAPSDRGLELAPGRHVAEVPVLGGRAKPVGVPVGVRVDGGAFPGVGAVSAVVDVPVDDGGRAAGQLSGLFRVGFEDGLARSVLPAADAVTVEVDVSGFAGGWFGEQASRLVVAWFAGCRDETLVLEGETDRSTRTVRVCDEVRRLETARDPDTGVLLAEIEDPALLGAVLLGPPLVGDAGAPAGWGRVGSLRFGSPLRRAAVVLQAGGSSGFGLASGISGAVGSFGATPLSNVGEYSVATQSGSFTTSYPIAVPAANGGAAPSVGLVYSSQALTGMSSATNNQASTVGLGWSLAAGGSITAHYETCGPHQSVFYGDFCPLGHEYTLELSGVSSRLVKVSESSGSATFRLKADPLWRIELLWNESDGAATQNADAHNAYWVVTTPDGTVHEFGKSGDSVDYAPVYTADSSLPDPFDCAGLHAKDHADAWTEAGTGVPLTETCQKAWRWNLSKVVDRKGNETTYSYTQELNWYGIRGGNDDAEYVQASHLKDILYTAGNGSLAHARVRFVTEGRCSPSDPEGCDGEADFKDTPSDLRCWGDDGAPVVCSELAATFWSQRRLAAIVTQVKDPGGSGLWDTVQWWDLTQGYPDPTASSDPSGVGSEPKLWLSKIFQRPALTNPGTPTGSATAPSQWIGWEQLEAEDRDGASGMGGAVKAKDFGGGDAMKGGDNGDWFRFRSVDFGDVDPDLLLMRYSADSPPSGAQVQFRLDDPATGTNLGTFTISGTGGWQNWDVKSKDISGEDVSGIHDVYVKFIASGSGEVARVNWFRFVEAESLPGLPATDYSTTTTTAPNEVHLPSRVFANSVEPRMRLVRIRHIQFPLGGQVNVQYGQTKPYLFSTSTTDPCSRDYADTNDDRECDFYIAWDPVTNGGEWWFWHVWKVRQVHTIDAESENWDTYTRYDYGAPRYAYSEVPGYGNTFNGCDPATGTTGCNYWNEFRGHDVVQVTGHNGSCDPADEPDRSACSASQVFATMEYRFHQGMDNDPDWAGNPRDFKVDFVNPKTGATTRAVDDSEWLAGQSIQTFTYSGNDPNTVLTNTVVSNTDNPSSATSDGFHVYATVANKARFVAPKDTSTTTYGSGTKTTRTQYSYSNDTTDKYVRLSNRVDLGDTSLSGDERRIEFTYNENVSKWIMEPVASQKLRAGTLSNSPLVSRNDYFYNGDRDLTETKACLGLGTCASFQSTTFQVDAKGRVSQVTDHLGRDVITDYNGTYGFVDVVTDQGLFAGGTNMVTDTVSFDPGFGVVLESEDPAGETTRAVYDEYGRLVQGWLPGQSGNASVAYTYFDTNGDEPVKVKTATLLSGSSYVDRFDFYDGFGRHIQAQADSPDGSGRVVTARFYNRKGVVEREAGAFDDSASPGGWMDPVWAGTSPTMPLHTLHTSDKLGRLTLSELISGNLGGEVISDVGYGYDRWSTTVTDAAGFTAEGTFRKTKSTVDAFGNMAQVVDYNGTSSYLTTSYSYDARDLLTEVSNSLDGVTSEVTYDALGRKLSIDDADMGDWSYSYDAVGNLATQTDARDQTLWFGYDEFNRMKEKRRNDSTGFLVAEWVWDNERVGALDFSQSFEDLTVPEDGAWEWRVTVDPTGYDPMGRVTAQTVKVKETGQTEDAYSTSWGYNAAGLVTGLDLPSVGGIQEDLAYTYSGATGLATKLTTNVAGGGNVVASAVYNVRAQPTELVYGSGGSNVFHESWTYNPDNLALQEHRLGSNGSGTFNLFRLVYDFDPVFQVEWIRDNRNDLQYQCYGYDHLYRLTEAFTDSGSNSCAGSPTTTGVGDYNLTYNYDKTGDITSVTGTVEGTGAGMSYSYNNASHLHAVTGDGTATYSYDGNGNMTTRTVGGSQDIVKWDESNRLYQYNVAGAGGLSQYVYDADGNRVVRIDDNSVTYTIGSGVEIADPGGTAEAVTVHYMFAGETVGFRHSDSGGSERFYLAAGHLGSNGAQVAQSDKATTYQYHLPFGDYRGGSSNGLVTEHTYTGQIDDSLATGSGLMFYNARYLRPTLRRFLSPDSIVADPADSQSHNRYAYVANNPVNWSDPSGHCSVGGQQIYAGHCRVGNNTPYDYGYETGCENCDVNAYNEYHAGSEEGPIGFVIGAAIAAVDTAQVWEWVPALGGTAVDFASAVGTGDTDRLARYWDAAVSTVADTYQTVVSGTARDRGRLAGELGLGGLASKLIKLRKLRSPATNAARGLYDDVLNVSDDALQGISASERRAVQSLQTQIESHQQKLADYLANPDAYDNLGFLQNAPTQQIRQQIIQGRVNHLSHEMATFADHIRKILGGA